MSVYIGAATKDDYSAMQGPAPSGFHIPLNTEWQAVKDIWTALGGGSSDGTNFGIALKLPFAGYRYYSSAVASYQGTFARYWSSSRNNASNAYHLAFGSSNLTPQNGDNRTFGFSVRCFKDTPTIPTSSWTKLYGTSIEAGGIFWSSTDGLISLSSDGQTWVTIADKNLGATTVWNSGDTLSEANCGKYYQRGNNYGFPRTGTIANQSTTQVDASTYGPGNYYSSDTFIKYNGRWDTTDNANLWGGQTGVQQTLKELKSAYIGEYINKESIVYKMNADSSGNLYVPIGGYAHSGYAGASYNWNISVDGGANTNYSGTGSSGGSITLSGYTAGSNHTITITPTTEAYGRALAYGWYTTAGATYLTEVVYDGSYMGYGESATSTGDYFRRSQYSGCTSLTTAPAEVLPDTVTSIGSNFRSSQYSGCTSLTTAPAEVLSGTVTTIGNYFRSYQCRGCTSLTTAPAEVLSGTVTTILTYFRDAQYYGCTSLTAAAAEALPNTVTSIGKAFRNSQYSGCTSLTTVPEEVLPNSVASFGDGFRTSQYQGCISLTTISGWKDLSIGGNYYRQQQFYGCTASKTVKVLSDVGCASHNSNTLQNSYVTTVSVPSAYLSNFTGASVQPRSSITDSKFIGY